MERAIPRNHQKNHFKTSCKFYDYQDTIKAQKSLFFEATNKYLMFRKVRRAYIHTLTFPVYKMC